jgi:hypothetical protein
MIIAPLSLVSTMSKSKGNGAHDAPHATVAFISKERTENARFAIPTLVRNPKQYYFFLHFFYGNRKFLLPYT